MQGAMEELLAAIAAKKAEVDRLRLRAPGGTANFDHSQDLELTFTSNAIEGNTLTAVETTMVLAGLGGERRCISQDLCAEVTRCRPSCLLFDGDLGDGNCAAIHIRTEQMADSHSG